MKKNILISAIFLFLPGCIYYPGAVTGKKYAYTIFDFGQFPEGLIREERVKKYLETHPETTEKVKNDLLGGYIFLGMDKEQAVAAWGKPKNINKSVYSWGVREQWVYYSSYLYFDDGILSSWQTRI